VSWAALTIALAFVSLVSTAAAQSVLTYHGRADRSGNFTMRGLSWERVGTLRLDVGFAPRFEGHLYTQPLYWKPPGAASGVVIVASESNAVTAIDAATGNTVWTAPAAYPGVGGTFVAFQGAGPRCPAGQRGDLTVLKGAAGTPPLITTA